MKTISRHSHLNALWFYRRVRYVHKIGRKQAYWLAVAKYGFENLRDWALIRKVQPKNWELVAS